MIHGLGGNRRSFDTIAGSLVKERELLLVDLPGHGASPAQADSGTFAGLADSVEQFVADQRLGGVDMVGTSMGARLVLELARRGVAGNVVALDPGGFWQGWERSFFQATIGASVRLLRTLRPALPALCRNPVSRTALLAQLSARPWALDGEAVASELKSYIDTPTFDALVRDLARGPAQTGPAAPSTKRVVIGWGRHDRLCLARQARRAGAAFPSATLHWFEHSGHFPMWDEPEKTGALIIKATEAGST
ncbi:MAG: alpha/beta fold hydrolase [Pseudomonadota bacterium]|nr:alpha/beta fold hydrolase [Pseudomonadota bacterium]